MSLPAFKARTHTLSFPATPFMARASVKMSPLKAKSSLNSLYTTLRESEEGRPPIGSTTGTCRCPTIMPPNPARMALLKG